MFVNWRCLSVIISSVQRAGIMTDWLTSLNNVSGGEDMDTVDHHQQDAGYIAPAVEEDP